MTSALDLHARVRLSLSMIVKNEADRLAGCLESMAGVADEIVITDTGSTDATIDIARKFGARVVEYPWNGNFSDARNESLRHCTGDWVIFLDADERLEPQHAHTLRALLADSAAAAYELTILSRTVDERNNVASTYAYIARLFRRHERVNFRYRIHESIVPAVLEAGGSVVRAAVTIHHIGYDTTHEVMQQKFERNLVPLRLDALEYPDDLFVLEKLSQTEMMLRHDAEAETVLLHIRDILERAPAPARPAAKLAHTYNLLSELCLWTERLADADLYALTSLSIAPQQYQANALLSRIYERLGRFDEAIAAVDAILGLCLMSPMFDPVVEGDCNVLPEDGYFKRALLLKKNGSATAAVQLALESALSANADHTGARTELALVYAHQENLPALIGVLASLSRTQKESSGLLFLRAQALARTAQTDAAIEDLWAVFHSGLRTDDVIFLLVRLLNEQRRDIEAIPLYEEYLARHPEADDARTLLDGLRLRVENN